MNAPKQQWKRILLLCKDTFRTQLGRLLVHILSPAKPLQERKQALELLHEVNHQEIMRDCLSPTLQVSFRVFEESLWNLGSHFWFKLYSYLELCG